MTILEHNKGSEMDDLTLEQTRDFYRAGAGFYRQSPWRIVDEKATIEVKCEQLVGGPWFAVILGRRGKVTGLLLFDGWEGRSLMAQEDYETIADRLEMIAVYFENWRQLNPSAVETAKQHGFEVAGPYAFPHPFRMEQGRRFRPLVAWELELLEACLCVIPDFLKRAGNRSQEVFEYAFDGTVGKMTLDLSWASGKR